MAETAHMEHYEEGEFPQKISVLRANEVIPRSAANFEYIVLAPPVWPPSDLAAPSAMRTVRRKVRMLQRVNLREDPAGITHLMERRLVVIDDDWVESAWESMEKAREKAEYERMRAVEELHDVRRASFWRKLIFLFTGRTDFRRSSRG